MVEVRPNALWNDEADAIVRAAENEADRADVEVVKVTGSLLDDPPSGTTRLLRGLGDVARRHGKRFEVGPI